MTLLKISSILAALSALAATPVLAHGGHAPVAGAAHGPLHFLMILGSVFAAGLIAYMAVRAVRARRSTEQTIQ